MTNKYTMEEKVKRLQELVPSYTAMKSRTMSFAEYWLNVVKGVPKDLWFSYNGDSYMYRYEIWDVHTGAAFTPLYRLL